MALMFLELLRMLSQASLQLARLGINQEMSTAGQGIPSTGGQLVLL